MFIFIFRLGNINNERLSVCPVSTTIYSLKATAERHLFDRTICKILSTTVKYLNSFFSQYAKNITTLVPEDEVEFLASLNRDKHPACLIVALHVNCDRIDLLHDSIVLDFYHIYIYACLFISTFLTKY